MYIVFIHMKKAPRMLQREENHKGQGQADERETASQIEKDSTKSEDEQTTRLALTPVDLRPFKGH